MPRNPAYRLEFMLALGLLLFYAPAVFGGEATSEAKERIPLKPESAAYKDILKTLGSDVFAAFPEETKDLSTALERKTFLDTDQGKKLAKQLSDKKQAILSQGYSMEMQLRTWEMGEAWGWARIQFPEYNVKQQAFLIPVTTINIMAAWGPEQARDMKFECSGLWCESLPMFVGRVGFEYYLVAISYAVSEKDAVAIEKNRKNIAVNMLFNISGLAVVKESMDEHIVPKATDITLQLVDKSTGTIVSERSYGGKGKAGAVPVAPGGKPLGFNKQGEIEKKLKAFLDDPDVLLLKVVKADPDRVMYQCFGGCAAFTIIKSGEETERLEMLLGFGGAPDSSAFEERWVICAAAMMYIIAAAIPELPGDAKAFPPEWDVAKKGAFLTMVAEMRGCVGEGLQDSEQKKVALPGGRTATIKYCRKEPAPHAVTIILESKSAERTDKQ